MELLQVIQVKNVRLTEMENILRHKEAEMAELKSQLDKFQSVFPFSRGRKTGHGGVATAGVQQRQRAQGISAEPQSESSVLELLHITFPKYDKEERWVDFFFNWKNKYFVWNEWRSRRSKFYK